MSNWRLRDCIIKLDQLIKYADELKHTTIAITDHEAIGYWVDIEDYIKQYPQLKIIRGNEIYLCRDGLTKENFRTGEDKYFHFILLAKDLVGAY